jgi:hypothetical protein
MNYCYLKKGKRIDMSFGHVYCIRLFRTKDNKRLATFENDFDAQTAEELINKLMK